MTDTHAGGVLRALERADLTLIRRWHNTPEIRNATFAFPFPAAPEAESAWYDRNIAAGDARNAIFGILSAPGHAAGAIVGLAMLRNIDWIARAAWFGVFIGEAAARGRGLGEAATREILAYGFSELGLNRIALEVASTNKNAIKLYEKLGFKKEGTMRQARFIDGAFVDVDLMAILRSNLA